MSKIKTDFNSVTGDTIKNIKGNINKYAEGWDVIFGNKITEAKTCVKCPNDVNTYCDYCGIRQCDGDEAEWSLNRVELK